MSEIIEFPKLQTQSISLVGKTLMLNVAMAPKFQCGGFSVTSSRLIDVVTERSQTQPLIIALEKGLLIDVSDNQIVSKGFSLKNSSSSRVTEEDTDKKAFFGRDKFGRMFVIIPKDDEERKKYEDQIAETGNINFNSSEEEFTGFSPIMEEEILSEDKKDG